MRTALITKRGWSEPIRAKTIMCSTPITTAIQISMLLHVEKSASCTLRGMRSESMVRWSRTTSDKEAAHAAGGL